MSYPDSSNIKSLTYRSSYLPGYDPNNEICHENQQNMSKKQLTTAKNWNTYQKNTWYQTYLNDLERQDCPIGVQGEFRVPGLAETKVNLMETGKWKELSSYTSQHPNDHDLNGTNRSSTNILENNDDFYAPETGLNTHSFRPHSSTNGSNGMNSTFNSTIKPSNMTSTMQQQQQQQQNTNRGNRTQNNHPNNNKTPSINPRTMFLPKTQKSLFGTAKEIPTTAAGSTRTAALGTSLALSSPTQRPHITNSIPFHQSQTNDLGNSNGFYKTEHELNNHNNDIQNDKPQLPARPMSTVSLSRRHKGVPIDSSAPSFTASSTLNGHTYNSKLSTLKASNQLNRLPLDTTSDFSHMSAYLEQPSHHPHPHSGYDRGLNGTLLIDDWRKEDLMKNDGKICFRPLSYDVLETLTYGPPDPLKKLSNEQNFPPLPSNRLNLIQQIFACLLKHTNSKTKTITIQQFLQYYTPSSHPAVISSRVTIQEILQGVIFDLLDEESYQQYEGQYNHPNLLNLTINFEQFEKYYRGVSAIIYCDEYFEILIRSTWKKFHQELPKSRVVLISQYSNRVDTSDFEAVLKSNGKKK